MTQTNHKPTKLSAGALRAAEQAIRWCDSQAWAEYDEPLETQRRCLSHLAEIIDRETGVAELLEAAKRLSLCLLNLCDWPSSERGRAIKMTISKLEQAIAKCERSE